MNPTSATDVVPEQRLDIETARMYPLAQPPSARGPIRRLASAPLFRLAMYYVVLIAGATFLIRQFPMVRSAVVTPVVPVLGEAALVTGAEPPSSWTSGSALLATTLERALTTLLVILGAVSLA